jgi:hypothetical protein
MQTNLVRRDLANRLIKEGATIHHVSAHIQAGVGPSQPQQVTEVIDFVIKLKTLIFKPLLNTQFQVRALIIDSCLHQIIIGLPTIQHYKLLAYLQQHMDVIGTQCELCPTCESHTITVDAYQTTDNHLNTHVTDVLDDEEENDLEPTLDLFDLNQPSDCELPQDIDGTPQLKQQITSLCYEYKDIFSTKLSSQPAKVEPLSYTYDKELWHKPPNRLPPRNLSVDKQAALSSLVQNLLDQGIIRESKATAWSQVVLAKKPPKGSNHRLQEPE